MPQKASPELRDFELEKLAAFAPAVSDRLSHCCDAKEAGARQNLNDQEELNDANVQHVRPVFPQHGQKLTL
jgi:hypothetical protein